MYPNFLKSFLIKIQLGYKNIASKLRLSLFEK